MSFFDDPEKCNVDFSIRLYGKEIRINNEYPDDVEWVEILSDITSALEASFGYSFDIPNPKNEDINLGIYVKDRNDD
jgi:hypothetical protein